jgi:parallel beta-helix repeat protein
MRVPLLSVLRRSVDSLTWMRVLAVLPILAGVVSTADASNYAAFVSQSVPSTLRPGQSATVSVTMQNTGDTVWEFASGNAYYLGSWDPQDNFTWGTNRAFGSPADQVEPGASYTFQFQITAPSEPGPYWFSWRMLQEAVEWFGDPSPTEVIFIEEPPSVNDAAFEAYSVPGALELGQSTYAYFTIRNTGNTTWTNSGSGSSGDYRLRTENPKDNAIWGGNRADLPTSSVPPNSSVVVAMPITAPSIAGTYYLQVRMIVEYQVDGFGSYSPNFQIVVNAPPPTPTNNAAFVSQQVPSSLSAGQSGTATVTFTNTGQTTWTDGGQYKLRSENPTDNVTWGFNRVYLPPGTTVAPGQSYTFTVPLVAPSTPGPRSFQVRMVQDPIEAFGDFSPATNIQVNANVNTNCTGANPFDDVDDTLAIQACLDRGGVVELSPGTPGHRISGELRMGSNTTLRSSGAAPAILRADRDLPIRERMLQTIGWPQNVTIDSIVFDGRNGIDRVATSADCREGMTGSNLILRGSGVVFRNSQSINVVCGSGMEIDAENMTIENNYFAFNGKGRLDPQSRAPALPWADGLTVWGCNGGTIRQNTFLDNTDLDLVIGATRDCIVTGNTIENNSQFAFAGLGVANDFLSSQLTPGSHSGSQFTWNSIRASRANRIGIGLLVGVHPWFDTRTVFDAGLVQNNTITGTKLNLVVDFIAAGEVTGNAMSNPRPGGIFDESSCSYVANYLLGHRKDPRYPTTAVVQDGYLDVNVESFGRCSPNPFPDGPPGDERPSPRITSPTSDSNFMSPATVTVTATATDSDGTVSKVEFFANNTLIGTDTTAPYSATTSGLAPGLYELKALAYDNLGAVGASPVVNITVSSTNTRPNVTLTAPANGSSFTAPASVRLTATASDPDGTIAKVEFYAGPALVATDTAAPYDVTWSSVPAGDYLITARAYDNGGAVRVSTESAIHVNTSNVPPTVALTSPFPGSNSGGAASVTLMATASDRDGSVSRVEFYAGATLVGTDTTSPYSVVWPNPSPGTYSLTAKAYDNLNASTVSASVAFTVSSGSTNTPPAVTISVPANDAIFAPSTTIQIRVDARDKESAITRVEFFAGSARIATDTTPPFSHDWIAAPVGSHTLSAIAYDGAGASTKSALVKVNVIAPDPVPALLQDDFNDNSLATALWTTTTWTGASSSLVNVGEVNQRIEIGPLATSASTSAYRGVGSAKTYNFTGSAAHVRLVQAPDAASTGFAMYAVGYDANNYYRFYVWNGKIYAQRRIAGVKTDVAGPVTYSATSHAFFRIRHVSNTVKFETAPSSNGRPGAWTQLYSESWNAAVKLTAIRFELKAGTSGVQGVAPGTVVFDDFKASPPSSTDTVRLYDGFEAAQLDTTKWSRTIITGSQDPTLPVDPVNGSLRIGPLPMSATHYNGITTAASYDFTGSYAQVELVTPPSSAANAQAMLSVAVDGSNHYRVYVSNGRLKFERKFSGAKTLRLDLAYSNSAHAFWRIRHDTGMAAIVFETAPSIGGSPGAWTSQWSEAPAIGLTAMKVELKAGVSATETAAPGTAEFDNVTIGAGSGVSTEDVIWQDPFRSALDTSKWTVALLSGAQDTSIPVQSTNGALAIGPLPMTSGYNGASSIGSYDLTGGHAWVRLTAAPAATSTAYAMLTLVVDATNHYRIWVSNGSIAFEKKINDVKNTTTLAFDATAHAFWRIRHDTTADAIVFETAPNQAGLPGAWVARRTITRELAVSALRIELKAGSSEAQTVAPGMVRFDDVRAARQ